MELSNTAKTVLEKRYLLKDDKGNIKETPDEMCMRVAENVSSAEKTKKNKEYYKNAFYNMLKDLQFLPNSPTLMNAGTSINQLSACISGDTLIYTMGGLKAMVDIEVGDLVLTHMGRFMPVTRVFDKGIKPVIELKWGFSGLTLKCTPDHKIYSKGDKWKRADKVKEAIYPCLTNSELKEVNKYLEEYPLYDNINKERYLGELEFTVTDNKESVNVYDIEVEEDHSFVAGDFICHNCFVLPVEDDMSSIFQAIKDGAVIHKTGGGCIAKGSLVRTLDGDKLIEDVKINDYVYSIDKNGIPSYERVEQTHIYDTIGKKILKVEYRGGYAVTTDYHPFAVHVDHKIIYKRADELVVGDLLVNFEGITKVTGVEEAVCDELRDLTVEKNNNYLASTGGRMVIIHNTGYSFSKLRPEGDIISTSKGESSGAVSFIKVFNEATQAVNQGGKRRGI